MSKESLGQQEDGKDGGLSQERREELVRKFADIRLEAKDYLDKAESDYQYILAGAKRFSQLGHQNSEEAERRRGECERFLEKMREEVALLEKLSDEALGRLDDEELGKIVRAGEEYISTMALQRAVINTYRGLPFQR